LYCIDRQSIEPEPIGGALLAQVTQYGSLRPPQSCSDYPNALEAPFK